MRFDHTPWTSPVCCVSIIDVYLIVHLYIYLCHMPFACLIRLMSVCYTCQGLLPSVWACPSCSSQGVLALPTNNVEALETQQLLDLAWYRSAKGISGMKGRVASWSQHP